MSDLFHTVSEARKAFQTGVDFFKAQAHGQAGSNRRKRILRIMRAAQRTDTIKRSDFIDFPILRPKQFRTVSKIAFAELFFLGNPHDMHAVTIKPVGNGFAILIVDPDNRRVARRDQPFLDRRIVFHRSMTVEMVRRQIEQDACGRVQRRRQIDLVG